MYKAKDTLKLTAFFFCLIAIFTNILYNEDWRAADNVSNGNMDFVSSFSLVSPLLFFFVYLLFSFFTCFVSHMLYPLYSESNKNNNNKYEMEIQKWKKMVLIILFLFMYCLAACEPRSVYASM